MPRKRRWSRRAVAWTLIGAIVLLSGAGYAFWRAYKPHHYKWDLEGDYLCLVFQDDKVLWVETLRLSKSGISKSEHCDLFGGSGTRGVVFEKNNIIYFGWPNIYSHYASVLSCARIWRRESRNLIGCKLPSSNEEIEEMSKEYAIGPISSVLWKNVKITAERFEVGRLDFLRPVEHIRTTLEYENIAQDIQELSVQHPESYHARFAAAYVALHDKDMRKFQKW